MLFTEPAFLFAFLPVLLGCYYLAPASARNTVLTLASLAFYALGELKFVPFMVVSIAINYGIAIWIERHRAGRWARHLLALGIASDLVLLLVFKYTGWLVENLDHVLAALHLRALAIPHILLPLGISFFTFHKISYKIDVYRGVTNAQRNPLTLALYILFFPQLIAGPIVRYHDIAEQLVQRRASSADFAYGVRRFVVGLAKKMIIANTVAVVADGVFQVPAHDLGTGAAWLGVVCYTLQIYFDFSGYSDMAIGLALMFGFRFLENFEHPYASASITEFWRRWHISLSRWFRDYLYIPLGGNRGGNAQTYRNLVIVFLLCGLWHGASWEFVVWGLFHGAFLVLERLGLDRVLARLPAPARHAYALLLVMIGWVFFRAGSLGKALSVLGAMFSIHFDATYSAPVFLDPWVAFVLVIGIITAFPVRAWLVERLARPGSDGVLELAPAIQAACVVALFGLLSLSLLVIAAGTYNPFLYFRF